MSSYGLLAVNRILYKNGEDLGATQARLKTNLINLFLKFE